MSKIHRVAILGGTGFVGRVLAEQLTEKKYQVSIPTREREQHRDLLVNPRIQLQQSNIHDARSLKQSLAPCQAVINLVGVLHDSKKPGYGFEDAHLKLTQNILDSCEELGIRRYLHMSSLNADSDNAPSQYLRSKGHAQNLVTQSTLNTSIFQPSLIFGQHDSFINRFAQLLKLPTPVFFLPSPNTQFAPVNVNDVSTAFVNALEDVNTYGQEFSCCGPKIYSMRELIELIKIGLGSTRKVVNLNNTLSKLSASILGILPSKPFTTDNYLSMQVNSTCKNNGLLKLNINPRSLESELNNILHNDNINQRLSQYRRTAAR